MSLKVLVLWAQIKVADTVVQNVQKRRFSALSLRFILNLYEAAATLPLRALGMFFYSLFSGSFRNGNLD